MTVKRINKEESNKNLTTTYPGISSPGPNDPSITEWTDEEIAAYVEYCDFCDEQKKKEEKTMKTDTQKTFVKVPVVNETKEVDTMTDVNNSYFGSMSQQMEESGHGFGEERPSQYADETKLGMHIIKIQELKVFLTKVPGNPDKGILPEIHETLSLKFTENGEEMPTVYINNHNYLYSGKERVNINVTGFIPGNAFGTKGIYRVPKEASLEKDANKLTRVDFNEYVLAEGQSVFSPVQAEYRVIRRALGIELLVPNADGVFPIPKGFELPIYVYEDIVKKTKTTVTPSKKPGGKVITETKTEEVPYFNVSFVAPNPNKPDGTEDRDGKFRSNKYGEYFSTSKSIAHKAECLMKPGVVAYLESLKK